MSEIFDYLFKKIISILYRIILVCWGLYLLTTFDNNYFNVWIYVLGFSLYVSLVTYLFFDNKKYYRSVRLSLDYIFILFCTWGKDTTISTVMTMYLIPIVNSLNHSNDKRSLRIYIVCLFCILANNYFVNENYIQFSDVFFILLVYLLITEITGFRESLKKSLNEIIDDINTFYQLQYDKSRLHKVYNDIIKKINSNRVSRFWGIELSTIICFIRRNDNWIIFNSSRFIHRYQFQDDKKVIEEFEKCIETDSNLVSQTKFSYNDSDVRNLIMISPRAAYDDRYIFLIDNRKKPVLALGDIMLSRYLRPILTYLGKLYSIHRRRLQEQSEFHDENRNKYEYILRSINAMHFVRNRLSPIKTFINVSKITLNATEAKLRVRLEKDRKSLIIKADTELAEIVKRADYLLEQSRNPFLIETIEEYTVRNIYGLIRSIWYKYFDEESIELFDEDSSSGSIIHRVVKYNYEHLSHVVTDILSNVSKYCVSERGVFIKGDRNQVRIIFFNDLKESDESQLLPVIKSYNSESNWEINKRKTFGLFFIKSSLNQMEIKSNLSLKEGKFFVELFFKVIEVEKIQHSDI